MARKITARKINENLLLTGNKFIKQREYWVEKLSGQSGGTILLEKMEPDTRGDGIQPPAESEIPLTADSVTRLLKLSKNSGLSIYILLLTALKALVYRYTGGEDIIVQSPVYLPSVSDDTINRFVLIRDRVTGDITAKELLFKIRKSVLDAYNNQDYPMEKILDYLSGGATEKEQEQGNGSSMVCMFTEIHDGRLLEDDPENPVFRFERERETVRGSLVYSPGRYEEQCVNQLARHYAMILETVLTDIDMPVGHLTVLTEQEKTRLLIDFNGGETGYPKDRTISRWFEQQVERTPERIAVVDGDERLSYGCLNGTANRRALRLRKIGILRHAVVGLMVERSPEMIAWMMAILKAGAAYLPLEPDTPPERIRYIALDSGMSAIVIQQDSPGLQIEIKDFPELFPAVEILDMNHRNRDGRNAPETGHNPDNPNEPGDLAYIMYTSGTTGIPKGVMIEHRNVVNLVNWYGNTYRLNSESRSLLLSSITFDPSVEQIFGNLLNGAVLYLCPHELLAYGERFRKYVEDHRIRMVDFVPGMLSELLGQGETLKCLETVVSGGDELHEHVKNALIEKGYNVYNHYGPTEVTVDALTTACSHQKVTLGKPIANVQCYVVNRQNRLQPVGVAGELWIAGAGVARGYLNNPELTAKKFIKPQWARKTQEPDASFLSAPPVSSMPGIYKTGDRARWLPDGNIEFLGRIDRQVKIRGHRIELEEIEKSIARIEGVKNTVVSMWKEESHDGAGEKHLCAYYVTHREIDGEIEPTELGETLSRRLPEYMIPSLFIRLEEMPLTPGGKVDRRRLPDPGNRARQYVAPRNETEKQLIRLWADVLGTTSENIGIDTNFFALGGYSLKATLLAAKIHREFDVKVPLPEIFKNPTVKGLARFVENAATELYSAIEPVEEREYYPMSSAQKRLYLLQQMDARSVAYNMPQVVPLEAGIRKSRLKDILSRVMDRHESLRTSFAMVGKQPVQRVHRRVPFELEWYEEKGNDGSAGNGTVSTDAKNIINRFIRPFDLTKAPFIRAGVLVMKSHPPLLMVDMHHAVSDGVSHEILVRDFTALYRGETLSPLRLQYKDYTLWQNRRKQEEGLRRQESYWVYRYKDGYPQLDIPPDNPRPPVMMFDGDIVTIELEDNLAEGLRTLAKQREVTLYMLLSAAYVILLSKLSGQEDIVVGTPVAGRRHDDLQQIVGMFVNTLAIRYTFRGDMTFDEFLADVKQRILEAFENQEYPFEDLVEKVEVNRDASRNPIFDVMFTYQSRDHATGAPRGRQEKAEKKDSGIIENRVAKFDLTLGVLEAADRFSLIITYAIGLFHRDTISRYAGYFKQIVTQVQEKPSIKISDIDIIDDIIDDKMDDLMDNQMDDHRRERLLYAFNENESEYPKNKTVTELFEEQVERTPERIAVVDGEQYTSYTYINRSANRKASRLRKRGVNRHSVVGIMMDRSPRMIAWLMAILKAGAAYLPVDPDTPSERMRYLTVDSRMPVIVTQEEYIHRQPEDTDLNRLLSGVEILDATNEPDSGENADNPRNSGQPGDLAYIMYTSGTTGVPKGVMIEHRHVVNLLNWYGNQYQLNCESRSLLMSGITFDPSVEQIFGNLLEGAVLVICNHKLLAYGERFRKYLEDNRVGMLNFVPGMLYELLGKAEKVRGLEIVISGGEALDEQVKNTLLEKGYRVYNHYGPTETTVDALTTSCSLEHRVMLGKPVTNVRCRIVNRWNRLQPVGVAGELWITGAGVARGYLNNPDLTAERFVNGHFVGCRFVGGHSNSHSLFVTAQKENRRAFTNDPPPVTNDTYYKTGDRARWRACGNIEFLGRIDRQVKIRGHRIELEEIERNIARIDGINAAVVNPWVNKDTRNSNEKRLCAYYTSEKEMPPRELGEMLKERLPDYMIPSTFIRLEEMPLMPGGKVDRRRLPDPAAHARLNIAPSGKTEIRLAELWAEILEPGVENIGVDTSFFAMGGFSLNAALLSAQIHKEFDVKIPLPEIFRNPTVGEQARFIENAATERFTAVEPVEEREYYPLSSAQKRLFILQQMDSKSVAYNMPLVEPLEYGVQNDHLKEIFLRIIQRHESFRTSFATVGEQPVQRIHRRVPFEIEWHDLRKNGETAEKEPASQEAKKTINAFVRPFDLEEAPLLRAGVLVTGSHPPLLMVDMHHAISDGVSHGILVRDFIALYRGKDLPPLKLQYKDYSHWQQQQKQAEQFKKQEAYWLDRYKAGIPQLDIPSDNHRPPVMSFEGGIETFKLTASIALQLKRLAQEWGGTPYMFLKAAYVILLGKLSGQEDIVVGTPVAGRPHADLQQIVGMFVNTLAIRYSLPGQENFKNFLADTKQTILEAFENQEYQFEDLVENLDVSRDASRNPVFDVMFNYQEPDRLTETHRDRDEGENSRESNVFGSRVSKFDLTLSATETGDEIRFGLQYALRLFTPETIRRYIDYFKRIINCLLENPSVIIDDIDMMDDAERERLLHEFNATGKAKPTGKTLHRLVAEQAERIPDRIALTDPAEGGRLMTYGELNRRAGIAAMVLRKRGVGAGTLAAIEAEQSLEMAVALLGILNAGAAYLPIDPGYPPERTAYILMDSAARIRITAGPESESKTAAKNTVWEDIEHIDTIYLDAVQSAQRNHVESTDLSDQSPDAPCYVIYTSGTTGRPKGVMVQHDAIVNTLLYRKEEYRLDEGATALQLFSFVFDGFLAGFFTPLVSGTRLILPAKDDTMDIDVLVSIIRRERVTHFISIPQVFHMMIETMSPDEAQSLKTVTLAGDRAHRGIIEAARRKNPELEIVNEYGVTEAAVMSALNRHQERNPRITVGKPICNAEIYILDHRYRLQPIGVPGECCIGGIGVAGGYLNNPELTAERFANYKLQSTNYKNETGTSDNEQNPGLRIYRTGDRARWMPDGSIEMLGRMDFQVKIRGYRIELEEIENRLIRLPMVKEAVVSVIDGNSKKRGQAGNEARNDDGDRYLCAYVVLHENVKNVESLGTDLKDRLSADLPHYMVPSFIVPLKKIPLTAGGKPDRSALPEPGYDREIENAVTLTGTTEKRLAEIWCDLLGFERDKIGSNTNFFDIGGHSLKAVTLATRIHRDMDVKLPLVEIFKNPTVGALARFIENAETDRFYAIEPVEQREYYPLSPAQKRLYILQQMDTRNVAYNMPQVVPMETGIRKDRLMDIMMRIVQRHESFRTSFETVGEQTVQRIHRQIPFEIEWHDIRKNDGAAEKGTLSSGAKKILTDFVRPFDLTKAPFLRAGVLLTDSHPPLLMVDMHHAISDGVSHGILVRDFKALYCGEALTPLKLQYKDYAQWQNNEKQTEIFNRQEAYWLNLYKDGTPQLDVPPDNPRPPVKRFEGGFVTFELEAGVAGRLKTQAQQREVTLYMLLTAAYAILLGRLGGRDDIVIGTPVANRRHADLQQIVGMFVNTLAIRYRLPGEFSIEDLLADVKKRTLEAFENQEYPFEDLVEKLELTRDASRNPLFDVMFTFLSGGHVSGGQAPEALTGRQTGDSKQEFDMMGHRVSKFDITLSSAEVGDRLSFTFEYALGLFRRETIERYIGYFKKIIEVILEKPATTIDDVEILDDGERERLLYEFNRTEKAYPGEKLLHGLLEEQAERNPHRVALVDRAAGERLMTYGELNRRAGIAAKGLRIRGACTGTVAAVTAEQSLEMAVALLAVLKAGAAYLPIDPELPAERIDFQLKDSAAELRIVAGPYESRRLKMESHGLEGAEHIENIYRQALNRVEPQDIGTGSGNPVKQTPANPCYIIYTSGTTGRPKGVLVQHGGIVNMLRYRVEEYRMDERVTAMQLFSFIFDGFLAGFFTPLAAGARLLLPEAEERTDINALISLIRRERATHFISIPQMFHQVIETMTVRDAGSLQAVTLAGDRPYPAIIEAARRKNPRLEIVNEYGVTEAAVMSTLNRHQERKSQITVGTPIGNTSVFILDRRSRLQPIGVPGELCIGGVGVARGYLNNPELTAERFANYLLQSANYKNETGTSDNEQIPGLRIYRTGDRARRLPDGSIELLGRMDLQVKIRGYRIEPAEIENRLLEHHAIKEAVVVEVGKKRGDGAICAYITVNPGSSVSNDQLPGEIREFLSRRLPQYMVPAYIEILENLPFTAGGKIDRKVLPDPVAGKQDNYVAPRDELEAALVKIWSGILDIESELIGIHSDFFELGGHSLRATQLVAAIWRELNIQLPLVNLFRATTISSQAEYIRERRSKTVGMNTADENTVLLKEGRGNRHLFMVHDGTGEVDGYIELCKQLSDRRNCWGIRAEKTAGYAPRNVTVEKLAAGYLAQLRKIQPHGPYALAGWSLGGTIAFEMARQLEEQNQPVEFFALIDSPPPNPEDRRTGKEFEFNLDSEMKFMEKYLGETELSGRLRKMTDTEEMWASIVEYLETNRYDVSVIKKIIMQHEALLIPRGDGLTVGRLVKYMNMCRALGFARAKYIPPGKISASVVHITARKSKERIAVNDWNKYTTRPVTKVIVEGDHYTILQNPAVNQLVGLLESALPEQVK
jgi:tyrocidine synthetase III